MTIEDLCAALRRVLEPRHDVRYAVLFGSAATRGLEHARDIDVAVSFTAIPSLMEEGALAAELERAAGQTIDLVNLDEASTLLRWEVARTGRTIILHDRAAWLDFSARIPIEWADLQPYFELESEGLRRALEKESKWSGSISSAPRSAG